MRNRHVRMGFVLLTLLALVAVLVNACGQAPAASPTAAPQAAAPAQPGAPTAAAQPAKQAAPAGAELTIAAAADLTGPFAPSGVPRSAGQNAYVRYVNEKLGGVNGVKIKLVTVDTSYDLNREVSAYKRFRDVDKALWMFNISSGAALAIAPMAEEDGMIHSHSSEPTATFRPGDGWFFPGLPMWMDGGGAAFKWWYETDWKKANPDKQPKVALMNMDALPGKTNARYWHEVLKQMNIPIVVDMFTPQTTSDTTNFVTALKDKQADIVIGTQTDVTWTVMVKDMKRLGVNIPKIAPYFGPLALDVMKGMGDAGVGFLSFIPYAMWDDEKVEGVKLIRSLYNEWTPGIEERRHQFYWGWEETAIALEGVKKALDKVGYDAMSKDIKKARLAVRDSMYDIKDFTAQGMIPAVQYSKEDRRPFHQVKVARIGEGAKIDILTDWVDAPAISDDMKTAKWWEQQ